MNPLLATLGIVCAMAGASVAGGGFWLWNGLVDNPGLVRSERARCAGEVEAAAARATRDEQRRQVAAGEAAVEAAAREDEQQRRSEDARASQLARENADYAQQRRDRGLSCALDGRDLLYLERMPDHGSAD